MSCHGQTTARKAPNVFALQTNAAVERAVASNEAPRTSPDAMARAAANSGARRRPPAWKEPAVKQEESSVERKAQRAECRNAVAHMPAACTGVARAQVLPLGFRATELPGRHSGELIAEAGSRLAPS